MNRDGRRLYAGIALSAAAVLVLEVGLTRIFSYTIWYHFAYLTISLALLGFGAGGSFLTAFPAFRSRRGFLSGASLLGQLGVLGCFLVVAFVPLDPLAITSDAEELARMLLYAVAVTLPFFAGGLCVAGTLQEMPRRVSSLYFADLVGAGVGCGAVVPLIWTIGTPLATALAAVAFGLAAVAYAEPELRLRNGLLAVVLAAVPLGFAGGASIDAAPTKYISLLLARPGAKIAYSSWAPINRLDVVTFDPLPRNGSYIDWGISPRYRGGAPGYYMIGNDGDACAVMYGWDGRFESLEFLRHHVLHLPYLLLEEPDVVAIGLGGGVDVLNALLNGASHVTGVELNPRTVQVGKELFHEFNGGILNHPKVEAVASEGRSFLRTRDRRYDLIEINSVDTLAALASGAYVLAESYLYTADAIGEYLDHLNPGGVFAMVVGDENTRLEPPRHALRLASVARHALERRGVKDPGAHVIVVGSPGTLPLVHTLVRNEPFTAEEVARVESFLGAEGFEFWHRPDQVLPTAAARILSADPAALARFYDEFPLNVRPVTDDSPFFFSFYKWSRLLDPSSWQRLEQRRSSATGQIVLAVMLVQSAALGAALILLPLRRVAPVARGGRGRRAAYLAYFTALGAGFILLEISLIQRFVLFLGYPTYALTVVLLSLLIFSGLGSLWTQRIEGDFAAALPRRLVLLLLLCGVYLGAVPALFQVGLGWPLAARIVVSVALLAPLGLVLGGFFPIGIRLVEGDDASLVPWAWAVNGCTTVIGTILAVMLGMAFGFPIVTGIAAAIYAAGVGAMILTRGRAAPGAT